ncbi:MAG: hypothetical protein JWN10_1166 [Solirubrobacterales bacterium]|nr:hypothetical protein [Solirubrobacterales bacterium]
MSSPASLVGRPTLDTMLSEHVVRGSLVLSCRPPVVATRRQSNPKDGLDCTTTLQNEANLQLEMVWRHIKTSCTNWVPRASNYSGSTRVRRVRLVPPEAAARAQEPNVRLAWSRASYYSQRSCSLLNGPA